MSQRVPKMAGISSYSDVLNEIKKEQNDKVTP